jgi:hypothetical protein
MFQQLAAWGPRLAYFGVCAFIVWQIISLAGVR